MRWLIILILLVGCSETTLIHEENPIIDTPQGRVCIVEKCFNVELAITQAEQSYGLMFRKSLAKDYGMLFIFEKPDLYKFWMKNTYVPLDIIWIDSGSKIAYIEHSALPCNDSCTTINPQVDAKYVLEVNAGLTEEYGFSVGDPVQFEVKELV